MKENPRLHFLRKAKGNRIYELQEKLQEDFQAEGKEYRQKLRSHTDTDTDTDTHTHKGMPKTGNTLGKWDISVQIFNR